MVNRWFYYYGAANVIMRTRELAIVPVVYNHEFTADRYIADKEVHAANRCYTT